MRAVILVGLGLLSSPVLAEAPPKPPAAAQDGARAAVDPERLAAAKEVVASAQGDRAAVLAAMKVPMVGMMQQMGVKEPDKAKVMVDEVIMPILADHYDELLSVQALSFAAVLPKEDLQAIAAFYATPAGRNLVKAQPQLGQAMLTGMQQWIGALAPEMKQKVDQAAEAHGWFQGGAKPNDKPKPN